MFKAKTIFKKYKEFLYYILLCINFYFSMLMYSINRGLSFFCSRNTRSQAWFTPLEHFTLRSTKNSCHLNNTLKYLSFKLPFPIARYRNGLNASPITPRNEKKLKTTIRNVLACSFLTYDEFQLLELMIPMRLRLCYHMLFVYSFQNVRQSSIAL